MTDTKPNSGPVRCPAVPGWNLAPRPREWRLPDGRPLLIERTAVAWIIPAQGGGSTLLCPKGARGPVPIAAPYAAVAAWWTGAGRKEPAARASEAVAAQAAGDTAPAPAPSPGASPEPSPGASRKSEDTGEGQPAPAPSPEPSCQPVRPRPAAPKRPAVEVVRAAGGKLTAAEIEARRRALAAAKAQTAAGVRNV